MTGKCFPRKSGGILGRTADRDKNLNERKRMGSKITTESRKQERGGWRVTGEWERLGSKERREVAAAILVTNVHGLGKMIAFFPLYPGT